MRRIMPIYVLIMALLVVVLAACSTDNEDNGENDDPLPTLAQPQTTVAAEVTEAIVPVTDEPTNTLIVPTATSQPVTNQASPTDQPLPSSTPRTFIPADLIITQQEFQREFNQRLQDTSIESAVVNFVPEEPQGMRVRMTAPGGQALVTGDVFISFQLSDSFLLITLADVAVSSGDPPAMYATIARDELYPLITETFGSILDARLGADHNLETLTFTQTTMEMTLLVPE